MFKKRKVYLWLLLIVALIINVCISMFNVKSKKENKEENIENNTIVNEVEIREKSNENEDDSTDKQVIKEVVVYAEPKEKVENKTTEKVVKNEEPKVVKKTTSDNLTKKTDVKEEYFDEGHLKDYPAFGTKYATLKINKIGVRGQVIFGATDEILLKGIAHDSGSYFPGENGSIIMCGHNYMNNFNRFGELKNGDSIEVNTEYGNFIYKIYDTKVVLETETDKLPIQKGKEILMIYTCYPFYNTGHTEQRYVLYAEKI